jgi:hypothetical protein
MNMEVIIFIIAFFGLIAVMLSTGGLNDIIKRWLLIRETRKKWKK